MPTDRATRIVFDSKSSAEAELGRWKSLLPAARGAYRPSGVVPLAAYPWMVVGALLGVSAGVVGGTVVLVTGGLLVYLLARIVGFFTGLPVFFYILVLVFIGLAMVVTFLAWLAMYAALGGLAGATVALLAGKAKSRGKIVQSVIGMMSALASVAVFFLFVQWAVSGFSGDVPDLLRDMFGRGVPGLGDYDFGWLAWVNGSFGAAVAVAAGAAFGGLVSAFCETCGELMVLEKLAPTSFECGERLMTAFEEGRVGEAIHLYVPVDDGPIEVILYRCPTCDSGFLELKARFVARYQPLREKDPRTIEEQWLFASEPLEPEHARRFSDKGQPKDVRE